MATAVNEKIENKVDIQFNKQVKASQVDQNEFINFMGKQDRSVKAAYEQSHPYSVMYTSKDLAEDAVRHNGNYMRLIFGGVPTENDYLEGVYNHTIRQLAEAPTTQENTLGLQTNYDLVPHGGEVTKDSLLDTFAQGRRFYKNRIDTDTERFMKARGNIHELQQTTYYGKRNGNFHHTLGQHAPLAYGPDLNGFRANENLSSRTYAPTYGGGRVPLVIQNTNGIDPRVVPVTKEPRYTPVEAGIQDGNDVGLYYGRDIDNYIVKHNDDLSGLNGLFNNIKTRT